MRHTRLKLIVIGASAGGIGALQKILQRVKEPLSVPVVVVFHLHKETKLMLPLVFGSFFSGGLIEAYDHTPLESGNLYFATADYHLLVDEEMQLTLTQEAPVLFSRPSIDVTFESAALALGDRVCGILLTGASSDGARGLQTIQRAGGYTIVQDPEEAEAKIMPQAAIDLIDVDEILSLDNIGDKLQYLGRVYADAEK